MQSRLDVEAGSGRGDSPAWTMTFTAQTPPPHMLPPKIILTGPGFTLPRPPSPPPEAATPGESGAQYPPTGALTLLIGFL